MLVLSLRIQDFICWLYISSMPSLLKWILHTLVLPRCLTWDCEILRPLSHRLIDNTRQDCRGNILRGPMEVTRHCDNVTYGIPPRGSLGNL